MAILAIGPRTGYELLKELGRRFAPEYRPSPGSVYPALNALRAEKLIAPDPGRGSGTSVITPAGRRLLAERQPLLLEIERRTSVVLGSERPDIGPVVERFSALVRAASSQVDPKALERIIDRAARAVSELEAKGGHA